MSIINQALKKAQREQLGRAPQMVPGRRYLLPTASTSYWPWLLLGMVTVGGMGSGVLFRLMMPVTPGSVAAPVPQVLLPSTPVPQVPAAPPRPVGPLPVATLVATPPRAMQTSPPVREPVSSVFPPPDTPPATAAPRSAPSSPHHAETLFKHAVAAQEAGQVERAMLLLQQAVTLDPTLKAAYHGLGNLHYQQQQYQQALSMYQQALAIDPRYVKARNNLGSTYLRLAMDTQAQEELYKVLAIDDAYGLAYYNLACVSARAGDSATAAQHLQRAMALEPQARLWAQTDEDFARVRTAAIVRQLLEP